MNASPLQIATPAFNERAPLSPEALLVRNVLVERGLETPMIETGLSEQEKL